MLQRKTKLSATAGLLMAAGVGWLAGAVGIAQAQTRTLEERVADLERQVREMRSIRYLPATVVTSLGPKSAEMNLITPQLQSWYLTDSSSFEFNGRTYHFIPVNPQEDNTGVYSGVGKEPLMLLR